MVRRNISVYDQLKWAMMRVAIGRKNWLFAGNDAAAENHARQWSLIATCERTGYRKCWCIITSFMMHQLGVEAQGIIVA
jgi:hypothetical protein